MKSKWLATLGIILLTAALWGCGSNGGSGGSAVTGPGGGGAAPQELGSASCEVCHLGATSAVLAQGWVGSAHQVAGDAVAGCEGCHGGGQFHRGTGPIPVPAPGPAECTQCHDLAAIGHVDDPATGTTSAGTTIEGYVVKTAEQTGCKDCHYNDHNPILTINQEWADSAHGGHLGTGPATDATAPGWAHYNWDQTTGTGNRATCQRCHTATGISNFLTDPATYNPANNNFSHLSNWTAATGSPQNEVLYCWGCHSDVATGALRNPGAIVETYTATTAGNPPTTVSYPDLGPSNVCMGCHIGREVGDNIKNDLDADGVRSFINSHYLTAGGTLFNESGYEYAGQTYNNFGFHKQIGVGDPASNFNTGSSGPCAACHMSVAEGHTFVFVTKNADGVIEDNNSPLCANCHISMDADTLEATKANFHAALEELRLALVARGIHFFNAHPYYYNAPDGAGGAFTNWESVATTLGVGLGTDPTGTGWKNVMGAAFNYNLLEHDPGAYAHNSDYGLKLIADSIDFLSDGVIDGDPSFAATLIGQGMNIASGAGYSPIHNGAVATAIVDPQGSAATCSACHPAAPHYGGSRVVPRAAQWVSTGLSCASCHASNNIAANPAIISGFADSRHGDVKGPGWTYSNAFNAGCQRCHTSRGFIANLNGDPTVVAGASDPYEVLTCNACHTSVVDGSLRLAGAYTATWSANSVTASVAFPDAGSSNLCIRCHSARRAGANITNAATTTAHYLPAATIVYGGTPNLVDITATANGGFTVDQFLTGGGYEFDGQVYAGLNAHGSVGGILGGPCVTCHMSGAAGHTWKPVTKDEATGQVTAINSSACATCHDGVGLPLMTPAALNAKKAQLDTALNTLEAQLNARDIYYHDGSFYTAPFVAGGTNTSVNNAYYTTKAGAPFPVVSVRNLQGAAYNLWLFKYHGADPAGYAHNPDYALKLVVDSADLLNDGAINGL